MGGDTIALVIIALANLVTGILTYLNHRGQAKTAEKIDLLERNTNSIKDALVESTAVASHAKGMVAGRLQEMRGERKRRLKVK